MRSAAHTKPSTALNQEHPHRQNEINRLPRYHGFSARPITFKVSSATLDIDGDGKAEALTDGLLIIRRLFGFESTSLIAGAISGDATITSADAIAERVDGFKAALDVDANGKTEADGWPANYSSTLWV